MGYKANGQLATSATTIYTASGIDTAVDLTLANTSGSLTETILVLVKANGSSTAQRLKRVVLSANETSRLNCIKVGAGDIIQAQTTDATTVDFTVATSAGNGPDYTYDANGNLKQVNGTSLTGPTTVTSTSANALAAGPSGATNPTLQIDASTSSATTGVKVKSAAGTAGVAVSVISDQSAENLTIDAKGTGTVTINGTATGAIALGANTTVAGTATVTSTSAAALDVGPNGATNPTLQVDGSTASAATGLKVKSAAAAAGLALSVISSGTNENLKIDAKGSGTITIGSVSTGAVIIGPGAATVLAGTLTAGGLLTCALQVATSGPLVYSGSGAPTISAAVKGSLYLRSDGSSTSTRAYIATDTAGTWTALTTAA
jgi:hypothetical protein